MKIKRIEVTNLKAIKEKTFDLNGCSIICTGPNNAGKTTFLQSFVARIQENKRPKNLQNNVCLPTDNKIYFDDGSRIEWNFTDNKESFSLITKDGYRLEKAIIKNVAKKLFGEKFDIDEFIKKRGDTQIKLLEKVLNFNVSDISQEIESIEKALNAERRYLKELKVKVNPNIKVIEKPNIAEIQHQIQNANTYNNSIMAQHNQKVIMQAEHINQQKNKINLLQQEMQFVQASTFLKTALTHECFRNIKDTEEHLQSELHKNSKPIEVINLVDLEPLQQSLQTAFAAMELYNKNVEQQNLIINIQESENKILKLKDELGVKKNKKKQILDCTILPKDFTIIGSDLFYNGFRLDDNQISSSQKMIAALKIALLFLGEMKTIHFDASALDFNSLQEVLWWSNENNLQLLIERPSRSKEDNEITFEIIER